MNKRICRMSVVMALITLSFLSCTKIFDWKNITPKPPGEGCEVAEYHLPYYDTEPLAFPFLFKKTYDATGKIVTAIDCSFWNVNSPQRVARNELILERKGASLFFLDKHNLADTVLYVYFNSNGRVGSLRGTDKLVNFEERLRSNRFIYENNRLAAIETIIPNGPGNELRFTSPLTYDSYGNVLSLRNNSYVYDITRKPRQQFYIDDYMDYEFGYYLLQYLGYFPEVTNPPNIRIHVKTNVFDRDLTGHSFDADNRLTGYQFAGIGKATITYHCK